MFTVGMLAIALAMAVNIALIVANRKRLGNRSSIALASCLFVVLTAAIAQPFFYGLNLGVLATSICAVIVLGEMQHNTTDLLLARERQLSHARRALAESRLSIATSQISPHFLGNVLNAIYYQCLTDPQEAAKSIELLSGHMNNASRAMLDDACAPISEELSHVRDYLELRHAMSPDKVRYAIDAPVEGFDVPPLSVITLVENAVDHGLIPQKNGGTIHVSTRELDTCFEVEALDDGIGFDTPRSPADDHLHVGLVNTRFRVANMCAGDLLVTSSPGGGTKAVIRIPKPVED